ncbi:MAG: hypothetical protein ACKO7Z_10550 [Cyanobacteriota bacterium]
MSRRGEGLTLLAFRLPKLGALKRPWVVVRHPLWRSDLQHGVLADFQAELGSRHSVPVLCWDTFNLQRRPGRCRQWMQSQGRPRRSPPRQRAAQA